MFGKIIMVEDFYAYVILPLRLAMEVIYRIPDSLKESVTIGSYVKVEFSGKTYTAIIQKIIYGEIPYKGEIKEILSIENVPPSTSQEMEFRNWVAEYYMCTPGEVFKAATGNYFSSSIAETKPKRKVSKRKELVQDSLSNSNCEKLSSDQESAFNQILSNILNDTPTLLKGVTGSGKTEIYIKLAFEMISQGKSSLIMVPEVALSRQLTSRLQKHFGEKLLVFHSRQTPISRNLIRTQLRTQEGPFVVLGLRSSLFLPFSNLGIIIIDEEHDSSYKQNDPAPRYNGRDSALMLAKTWNASVVLGSATPSLESIYNCYTGRYSLVELNNKYFQAKESTVEIIDTIREQKRKTMEGLFSTRVLEAIKETIDKEEQVLIFRNRRSFSPMVQCLYCGDIPSCKNCNVSLNYHKQRETLKCHYCEYSRRFSTICTKCGKPGLKERGCGTEMIEEQIAEFFPNAKVARLDAETTSSKTEENKILTDFATGKTDILVGTQMVSKGFDFAQLTLIVLIQADSMFATEDFRATEKALQMLVQLAGRGGRRETQGHIIIQTSQPHHRVYHNFLEGEENLVAEIQERKEFEYPPFTRLIKIILKNRDKNNLNIFAQKLSNLLPSWGVTNFNGPFAPAVDWIKGEHILHFWIKLRRNQHTKAIKSTIFAGVELLIKKEGKGTKIHFDADPL